MRHNPPPKNVTFGYYQKYNNNNSPPLYTQKNVTKKYNITHPLKMLYLAITKSTTTTNNPPLFTQMSYLAITKKYNITHPLPNVVFGYYQKYNITHPLKMLHLVITQTLLKVQHNPPPKDVAFGYYQKYNNSPPLYTQKKPY